MDAGTLHNAIAEVCPITSCSVGKEDDRTTWSFEPGEGATDAEKTAGQNVIDTIPVDFKEPPQPTPVGAVAFNHENRIRGLEGAPPLTLGDFQAQTKVF
jgi:hypothetical protein